MITIITCHQCTQYGTAGHPERSERVSKTVAHLKKKGDYKWLEAKPAQREDLLRVHPDSHVKLIEAGKFAEPDTPAYPDIFNCALLSAGAAIQAAELGAAGKRAFSLMRPPGHHATKDKLMGFCYFNNVAVALEALRAAKKISRTAVFDFDCHHGNGTEAIYEKDPNTLFVSIHQHPCYPGTGLRSHDNCLNFPLMPYASPQMFLESCDEGLEAISEFKPDLVAISAGFDAYKDDPITQMSLEVGTFRKIGQEIARTKLPSFALLEGGYSDDLPLCVEAFLEGWDSPRSTGA